MQNHVRVIGTECVCTLVYESGDKKRYTGSDTSLVRGRKVTCIDDVEEETENRAENSGDGDCEASLRHISSEYIDFLTPIPMMSGLPAMMQVPLPLTTPIASVEFIP